MTKILDPAHDSFSQIQFKISKLNTYFITVWTNQLSSSRRGGRSEISHKIGNGKVYFMANCADDRNSTIMY